MEEGQLERSILGTLAYYHALGVAALTSAEIFRYLIGEPRKTALTEKNTTFHKVLSSLNHLKEEGGVKLWNGHYLLGKTPKCGWEEGNIRLARLKDSIFKRKIILRAARFLAYLPYVRLVAISGSTAIGNADQESDLDIIIGSSRGHIWTTRMLVTVFTHLLGKRRYGTHIRDRICLNHYIEAGEPFFPQEQISVAAIYAQAIPVFGTKELENSYNNSPWIGAYSQNVFPERLTSLSIVPQRTFLVLKTVFEFIADRVAGKYTEKIMEAVEKRRISRALGGKVPDQLELYMDNGTLMFHYPFSRSKEALQGYQDFRETVDKV